jgi:hypothetical protein
MKEITEDRTLALEIKEEKLDGGEEQRSWSRHVVILTE